MTVIVKSSPSCPVGSVKEPEGTRCDAAPTDPGEAGVDPERVGLGRGFKPSLRITGGVDGDLAMSEPERPPGVSEGLCLDAGLAPATRVATDRCGVANGSESTVGARGCVKGELRVELARCNEAGLESCGEFLLSASESTSDGATSVEYDNRSGAGALL